MDWGLGFLVLGAVLSAITALSTQRGAILAFSLACATSYGIYWGLEGEMVALAMTGAAIAGIAVQLFTPQHLLAATFMPRLGSALVIAAIGFALTYKGYTDLLPLTGFLIARLGEVFTRAHMIRGAYLVSTALWLAFAHVTGNDLAALCNLIVLVIQIGTNLRDMRVFAGLRLATVKRVS